MNDNELRPISGSDYARLIEIMEQHADLNSPRNRHILRKLKHNQPIQDQIDRRQLAAALKSGSCIVDTAETLKPNI